MHFILGGGGELGKPQSNLLAAPEAQFHVLISSPELQAHEGNQATSARHMHRPLQLRERAMGWWHGADGGSWRAVPTSS